MVHTTIDNTYGALLIGYTISCILLGLTTAQYYWYSSHFPEDRKGLKILAFAVWFLEVLHQGTKAQGMYTALITGFGDPLVLASKEFAYSINLSGVFAACIGLLVQSFYTYRVWKVTQNAWLSVALFIGTLFTFAVFIANIARGFMLGNVQLLPEKLVWLIILNAASAAFVDLALAICLCGYLFKQRELVNKKTTTVIDKVVMWTMETGLLTSFLAVVVVACVAAMPYNSIWMAIVVTTCRVYANSMLAMLNGRNTLRILGTQSAGFSLPTGLRSSVAFQSRSGIQAEGADTLKTASNGHNDSSYSMDLKHPYPEIHTEARRNGD